MKRVVVVGATSAIGFEVCRLMLRQGWKLGVTGRSLSKLQQMFGPDADKVEMEALDVLSPDAPDILHRLIEKLGGMDIYFHVSGIGHQNPLLDASIELTTVQTNAEGFARMVGESFRYMSEHGGGHVVLVSSIAGTKGLGMSPAYSATKAFGNVYMEALEQLAYMRRLPIHFTDIRPGFVRTPLLDDGKDYPLLMSPDYVAKRIFKAILHRRHVATIDWRYRILAALWKLIPRSWWCRMNVRN